MRFLFSKEITGWDSWGNVFCDLEAFSPLTDAIFEKEKLVAGPLTALTPGTNAVFRAEEYVIKVFAPAESGIGSDDYPVELKAHWSAAKNGVRVPAIVAHGEIQDRYLFRYLIMRYIHGTKAGEAFPTFSKEQKRKFVDQMLFLLEKLHKPTGTVLPPIDVIGRAVNNSRLHNLPPRLAEDMRARASSVCIEGAVLVHGDITGENVLICPDGEAVLIDFADSLFAPPLYELAPLAFDLFKLDRDCMDVLIGDQPMDTWLESLMSSIAVHDFGANIVLDYAKRNDLPIESIQSLNALMRHILSRYS